MLNTRERHMLRKLKPRHTQLVEIKECQYVYEDFAYKDSILVARPLHSELFCILPKSENELVAIDPMFRIDRGTSLLTLKRITQNPSTLKRRLTKISSRLEQSSGYVHEVTDAYCMKKVFQFMKDNNIAWRRVIRFLLDTTSTQDKDERIVDLAISSLYPLPLKEYFLWQKFNNHAIVLTNSGVAKSTTYEQAGFNPSCDYSIPGMIGSVIEGKATVGSLAGTGAFVLDEFTKPELREHGELITYLLNLLESGFTKRTLQQNVDCISTKQVLFFGNCRTNKPDGYSFMNELVRIATEHTPERVGRRFAHIYYGSDFTKVPAQVSTFDDKVLLIAIRLMINSAVNQSEPKTQRILHAAQHWLSEPDNEYEHEVLSLLKYIEITALKEFLMGCSRNAIRLRMAGLKWSIISNLDIIVMEESLAKVYSKVMEDANAAYIRFKSYNMKSYQFMINLKRKKFVELYPTIAQGVTLKEIADRIEVPVTTCHRWKEEIDKELLENPEILDLPKPL